MNMKKFIQKLRYRFVKWWACGTDKMEVKGGLIMAKAVLCPVCNGVGKVSAGFYNRGGDCQFWVSGTTSPELCRSCNGKGWVEVNDNPYVGEISQSFLQPTEYLRSLYPITTSGVGTTMKENIVYKVVKESNDY